MQNKRDLPWRATSDPYPIWLSEVMLQQTRVSQALPYYHSFLEHFPTVKILADADEEKVLKLWQGLGYYSRARNMHGTAKMVSGDFDGIFPDSFDGLKKLKGIGDYTAAAIASFAFKEQKAVVDGNVYRVLSRYFDIDTDISTSKAKKEFSALADALIPEKDPDLFNQAIMEFGAIQCTPKNPGCGNCPLSGGCLALSRKTISERPVKTKKQKITKRHFNYLLLSDASDAIAVQKREGKGIWQNLYEFPLVETLEASEASGIYESAAHLRLRNLEEIPYPEVLHKLSHQHLHIKFWKGESQDWKGASVQKEEIGKLPVPVVLENFIRTYLDEESGV